MEEKRGFARMTKEQRAEISRKGGIAAHKMGKARQFSSDEAREAGRRGGLSTQRRAAERAKERAGA